MSDRRPKDGFLARQPSAVDNAFSVLELVSRSGPGITARAIVEALPLSKATVYRILKHLIEQEYLVRTPDLTGFALGRRVLDLVSHAGTDAAAAAASPATDHPVAQRAKGDGTLAGPSLHGA